MAKAYTNDDGSIRESLMGMITNIDPTDYQLYTGLAKTKANSTLHEWPVDTLKTVGTNAQVEGFDPSYVDRTDPSRVNNRTQIISAEFDVTNTERAVTNAGFEDRYSYEMRKAMKEWKNDAEFALVRGSLASGSGSAARQMRGLKTVITTNATNASGVSLSETMLNDYLQNTWTTGGQVDEIYVPMRLKRRISGFTAGNVKNVNADDKRLTNRVDVYEADTGVVKLFAHRHITTSGDTNFDIIGIQSDKFQIAHLREPEHKPLAATGDSTKGMIVGELTLVYLAEKSSFYTSRVL